MSRTQDDLLSAALGQHRAGDLDAAEALYRRTLQVDPGRHAARHLLGVLAHQRGRSGEAASLIAEAIRANGAIAEYHGNLGLALAALGHHAEAEASQRRALALRADYPEAHHNLGLVLTVLGRHGDAIGHFSEALRLRPGFAPAIRALAGALHSEGRLVDAAEAYAEALRLEPRNPVLLNDFGLVLRDLGRDGDAARCFDAALALHPDFAEAWDNLGALRAAQGRMDEAVACHRAALARRWDSAAAWNNLGIALNALGRGDDAIAVWRQALVLEPGQAEGWSNLGNGLRGRDRFDDAIACHRRALRLVPAQPAANNNHGHALQGRGRHGDAARWFRRALALDPAYAEALSNLGLAVQRSGCAAEAERLYDRALALQPGLALARFDRALLRLERGDLPGGWADYDWRFAAGQVGAVRPPPPLPEWRGEELAGKRLLVRGEQGVGDTILFASLIPEVVGRAAAVVVEVDRRMVPLFARSFPGATVRGPADDPAGCDLQTPIGSLAGGFRAALADFRSRPAWLTPAPALVERWSDRLAALGPGLRVGIGWRSQVMTEERRTAYTPLEAWGPVFALPGLHVVNLQYGDCAVELADAEARFGRPIHRWDDLDLKDDFDGTAALIANLDLVLSPAMSVGELAGALGVPVWRVGRRDWTQLGTAVRPWFPTQRLFQPAPKEKLGDVPARMARALAAMAPR